MKWIGQHIYNFISRFRNDVYLEDLSTTTETNVLVVDSSGKVSKSTSVAGDLTSIVAGTGLSGTDLTGPIPTLNVDSSQLGITSIGTLGSLTVDNITIDGDTITASADLALVATGNDITIDTDNITVESATESAPKFELKATHTTANKQGVLAFTKDAADTEDGESLGLITFSGEDEGNNQTRFAQIKGAIAESDEGQEGGKLLFAIATHDAELQNGLQLIDGNAEDEVDVTIASGAASVTTIAGTLTMGSTAAMTNAGLLSVGNQTGITGTGTVTSGTWNSAGTITTASQPNFTTLAGLTSLGTASASTNIAAGDLTMYNAVNDGNPTFSIGSSDTERFEIKAEYESGAQGLDLVRFTSFTAGSGSDDGRYAFEVDDAFLLNILDGGLRIKASGFLEFGSGNEIISDSSGTTTLKNIDALDATTESTIEAAIDTLSNLTTTGTIGTGVWNATKILSPKTTHVIHYPFSGYAGGLASGNFQFGEDFSDPQAPFQLNSDYGATAIASGNLPDVSDWFRSSGTVMPRAVTATKMYGWVTCGGTDDITIALCKVTPTRNSTAAVVPIVVATTVIAAINNDKMDFFDVTASDAGTGTGSIVTSAIAQGDILMPFIIVPNAKTAFFNLTLEVEA